MKTNLRRKRVQTGEGGTDRAENPKPTRKEPGSRRGGKVGAGQSLGRRGQRQMSTRDRESWMWRSLQEQKGPAAGLGAPCSAPGLCAAGEHCKRGGEKRVAYLHGDYPQLLGSQPPHLTRQHLRLIQDGEVGVGHGAQDPACHKAEQPEGRPRGPRPARAAGTAADQSGRPYGLLFLGLAGHAASGHSRRRDSGAGRGRRSPPNFPRLLRSRLRGGSWQT